MAVIHTTTGKPQAAAAVDRQQFTVVAWRHPVVELLSGAVPTRSDEALVWWTPSVGPTGMLIAHRFAAYASEGPTTWRAAEVAATFGMGGGKQPPGAHAGPPRAIRDHRLPRQDDRGPADAGPADPPATGSASGVPGSTLIAPEDRKLWTTGSLRWPVSRRSGSSHAHQGPPTSAVPSRRSLPALPGYDWSRLGLHTFRVSAGTVIDFPVPIVAGARAWIVPLWPDARTPTGWGGWAWQADPVQGRGWLLPERLMCGDVVDFAVDQPDLHGQTVAVRWRGIFDAYNDGWRMTIQGPYASPADAHAEAEQLLAVDRSQPPKTGTTSDAGSGQAACTRTGRRRRRS